ncbi:MAG: tetratricopeptide repeat protein, partial [Bacteroidota bacterium]
KDEDKYDNHLVEDFVKIVGYHPLTIELIAKTLASSNLISLSDLLQMFEEKGIRFEGQNQIEMPSYERVEKTTTTFKCLSVAFDISSFEKEGHVVEILSVFAIAPVSGFLFDELLIYISRINQFKIDETIQTLLRKGWLSYFGNRIIMHPVIQEVLRIKLSVNIKSCHFYIANVLSAIKESKTKRYNVLDTNKHISFAIAAFDHLYKDIDFATVDDLALSKIGLSIGEYFFEHSDYNRALKYELKSLKILRKLYGEFDLGLKDILNNIAETYAFLGEYDKSLEYHERCLEIKLKLSPSDSEGIAASLNNLGNLYYYKDSYEMAVQCFKEALDKWKECGNEFHLSSTMTNLGLNYYYLNNHEDAILYHKQAIEINEKIMGSDHPDLGRSYFGIVPSLISVGNFDGAEEYLTKAKNIFEKVFEPSHDLIADVNDWFLSIAKAREEKSRDES